MTTRPTLRRRVTALEVFSLVVLGAALPCLLYVSDRCSLAMALCGDWHVLGIKRYFAELWWAGIALGAGGARLGSISRRGSSEFEGRLTLDRTGA